MVIASGYNIAGPEVEACLLLYENVHEYAVIAMDDEQRGQIFCAYVVLKEPLNTSGVMVETLQNHLKSTIRPYKYSLSVHFIEALPKTATGKLKRFALKNL